MTEKATRAESPDPSGRPKGAPGRVTTAHRQAGPTLGLAALFVVAAAVVALAAGSQRWWMALHLLLLGGVLSAISATTQLFAITWSAATPPPTRLVSTQRWLLATGVVALVVGQEMGSTPWVVAAGGAAILTALALLALLLVRIRRTAVIERFLPSIDGYLLAIALGLAGSGLGLLLALDGSLEPVAARDAHTLINVFGLVGVVVAATLPTFFATEARTRMSPRYRPGRARAALGLLGAGVATAAVGQAGRWTPIAAAGLAAAAVAMVATVAMLPRLGVRQWRWAGPRLAQLVAALVWWAIALGWAAAEALGSNPLPRRLWLVLAVGGIAQLVVGALAYLGPIMRGRDHRSQARGFAITRSWVSLLAGNVAAAALVVGWWTFSGVALAVWVVDAAVRGALLVVLLRPRPGPLPSLG
ncbi:MAG: hypothetical protein U5K29_06435 [Acidimicrobiales bacterium]|nr:hypothetical protein [Acidimicrobiales bacterium]